MKWPARRTVVLIALTVAVSGCVGGPEDETPVTYPEPLIFSETPSGFADVPLVPSQAVLKMLSKETGRTIRAQVGTDYDAVINAMSAGTIDIGALSPFSYVRAKQQNPAIIPVAAQTTEKGGKPGYRAYGIVRTGSRIRNLADFRGRRICFVDDDSTSGYVYPSAALLEIGIRPLEDTVPIFKVDHEAVVNAVVADQCDAGFAYDTMVDRQMIERGQLQPGQVDIVWKSDLIPGAVIVISDSLPVDLRKQLTSTIREKANSDYLRANSFCHGECPISDANAYAYTEVDDSIYDSIRAVCQRIQHRNC
ncbi:phosphate/phosphite/phosphonate ABC transporter substrate-binding protein [Actinokineospora iranica]|uniref:Phosphonate transport system substrate-binding protein n=1 Tax=Actinokineospora iranica TaxID=1271860 RepID=A0A1G6JSR0_9PSEU|nr:phosphate/phosphite/phosphonate ABC transporter substrate-binding protein [Actinokineospora iranica]SDC21708.1 phosphonate transport system substrate-binding protein [Actinokineospora iranica]